MEKNSVWKSSLLILMVYLIISILGEFIGYDLLHLHDYTIFSGLFVGIILLIFMKFSYHVKLFEKRNLKTGLDCVIVGLIVVFFLNNDLTELTKNLANVGYILISTLKTTIYEETIFRVVLIFIIGNIFAHSRNKIYWKIYLSSAIFALAHLVNMISVSQPLAQTIIQLLYAFCLGTIFAISYLATDNILFAMGLHFLADSISLLLSSIGEVTSVQLNVFNVIMIVGMLMITVMFNYFILKNKNNTLLTIK